VTADEGNLWLEEKLWGRWEVIRRHKPYRNLCDRNSHAFDGVGVFDSLDSSSLEATNGIMERYGLTAIVHYREDIPPPFRTTLSMGYIYSEIQHTDGVTELYPVWDGHHIRLKIDIGADIPFTQLMDEFTEAVEQAREIAGIKKKSGKVVTVDQDTLKVWDLHIAKMSPKQIAEALWPEDY
jgi:hypothetical protein